MKPLLSVREAAIRMGKTRRAAERWLKNHERLEPQLRERGDGGKWSVRTDILDKMLGMPDAAMQAQIDALQRQVNVIEARLDSVDRTQPNATVRTGTAP